MKRRWAWVWTLTHEDGTSWFGTCPVWAAQSVPAGSVLTRVRVMVVGKLAACAACNRAHPEVSR